MENFLPFSVQFVHNTLTTVAAMMISIKNRKFSFIMFDLMILFPKIMINMDDSLPQTLTFTLPASPNLVMVIKTCASILSVFLRTKNSNDGINFPFFRR